MTVCLKDIFFRLRQGLRVCGRSFNGMMEDKGFTHAAAIAYYAVFSIFPLLLFSIAVLGFFLEGQETQQKVLAMASRYFPAGTLRFIRENINSIVEARTSLSLFSLAGLLWAASRMFDGINEAVNTAWGIRESERFITSKIKSIGIVLFLVLMILCSTLLTTQSALFQRFESLLLTVPWGEWLWEMGMGALAIVSWIISMLLTAAAFILTYRFLPRTKVRWGDVWVAAFLAATLWELSKRAFIWYVARFTSYSQVYGSISAVLVLLLWTYLSALILIWGAEFAAEHTRLRKAHRSALAA